MMRVCAIRRPRYSMMGAAFRAVLLLGLAPLVMGAAGAESARDASRKSVSEETAAPVSETEGKRAEQQADPSKEAPPLVRYIPRSRGKAEHTAAGGTRSSASPDALEIALIAPIDHVAQTTRAQPILYWFVSKKTKVRIDLTLIDDEAADPLLEMTLPSPVEAGFHELDLEELGLELEYDHVYRWSVAVVRDEKRTAAGRVFEAFIERTEMNASLEKSLRGEEWRFAPYAVSGIWYDAMIELRAALDANPTDERLREQEIALLEQLGLDQVVGFQQRTRR